MTDPVPCTIAYTDSMREVHRWIMSVGAATALMTCGVLLDRLRMLWGDYRKRHNINGSAEI